MKVRTRFAPSPTGFLHIGGARTALFSYLFARRHGGDFILRIEDTDRERSTDEAVNAILEGMAWLGLEYDEGPFYQTKRMERYQQVIQQLLDEGKAYYCYQSKEDLDRIRDEQMAAGLKPRYNGEWRECSNTPPPGVQPVIRFKNPLSGEVVVDDAVRGRVVFDNAELDDLVIARADGTPTYNFTVVVDDIDMEITHVVRGDDHLNNTPRQMNIIRALGKEPPQYAHVPMILDEHGKKLSKRTGAASVMEYRDMGFLPEAVLNYLVRLGWAHGDQEIFSREEMIRLFDVQDINNSASSLNPGKLAWLNQHYIKTLNPAHVAVPFGWHLGKLGIDPSEGPAPEKVVTALVERAKTLVEMAETAVYFYREPEGYEEKAAKKNLTADAAPVLADLKQRLAALSEWTAPAIHAVIEAVAAERELGMGKVAQPLRVAVSGTAVSPPIDATVEVVGRESTVSRLEKAIAYIESQKGA